ncbi:MAG TPA: hypothetical protein VK603_02170, partial [Candidatus Saccharimonadales bacterium]|nr:hypothetical protein [Candidatus Saccharimonadales bacterium]
MEWPGYPTVERRVIRLELDRLGNAAFINQQDKIRWCECITNSLKGLSNIIRIAKLLNQAANILTIFAAGRILNYST